MILLLLFRFVLAPDEGAVRKMYAEPSETEEKLLQHTGELRAEVTQMFPELAQCSLNWPNVP
jgi:hypothetical protein